MLVLGGGGLRGRRLLGLRSDDGGVEKGKFVGCDGGRGVMGEGDMRMGGFEEGVGRVGSYMLPWCCLAC